MPTEPIKVIADIIQTGLGLEDDQVLLYNQKFDIPPDERIYVTLAILGVRTFGASTTYRADPVTGDLVEVNTVNRQELYSIRLMSRNSDARTRNWEIPAALVGTFAQQQSEINALKIGYLPTSMNDVSSLEGTARLFRYALTIQVLVAYEKVQPVQYFNQFATPQVFTNP